MTIIRPTLNYVASDYLADTNGKPLSMTFSRATSVTRVNAIGNMALVPSGVLRHDYDPLTGEYKGWLIEEARTNLLSQSEQFDNAAWTMENATVTTTATTAPDGAMTAEKLVESTLYTYHRVHRTVSVTSGVTYTLSVFAKISDAERPYFRIETGGAVFGIASHFNLSTGAVVTNGHISASITCYGNGWYRCTVVTTATSTGTAAIYLYGMQSLAANIWVGDGTSGMYLWGAQLEAGAGATSYIPTTSAPTTRNADFLTAATSAFPFNASEGTLYVDFDVSALTAPFEILRLYSGSSAGMTLWHPGSGTLRWEYSTVTDANVALSAGGRVKVAITYGATGAALCVNGAAPLAKPDSAVPAGLTTLAIGGGAPGWGLPQMNGHIRHVAYFPRRLSNTDLQAITR